MPGSRRSTSLACQGRSPNLGEVPVGFDADVYVDSSGARGLGEATQPMLLQDRPGGHGNLPDMGEGNSWSGIYVHPELILPVKVGPPDRPRIQIDAAQIDGPRQVSLIHDDQKACGSTTGEGDHRALYPLGPWFRDSLLEEELPVGPVGEPLERGWTVEAASNRSGGHGKVVLHQLQLGCPEPSKEDLIGVGDGHFVPIELERLRRRLGQ